MKKVIIVLMVIFGSVVCSLKAKSLSRGEFRKDGTIVCGTKVLTPANKGTMSLILDNGALVFKINQAFVYSKHRWFSLHKAKNAEYKVDFKEKKWIFKATFPDTGGEGKYTLEAKLLKNGLILIKSKFKFPESIEIKNTASVLMSAKFSDIAGKLFNYNGKNVAISSEPPPAGKPKNHFYDRPGKNKRLVFFPDEPSLSFTVTPLKYSIFKLWEQNNAQVGLKSLITGITPSEGEAEFYLDLRTQGKVLKKKKDSPHTYCGIDFWKLDRRRMPEYNLCRNLVQNPSFEQGLRYYYKGFGAPWDGKGGYKRNVFLDNKTARFGRKSLRMLAAARDKYYGDFSPGTFPIPLEPGEDYILSFYAKTDIPSKARIRMMGLNVHNTPRLKFKGIKTPRMNDKWQRYVYSVKSLSRGASFLFWAESEDRETDGWIWLDGIQLEKGNKVTDYTQKPVEGFLDTGVIGNFLEYGKPVDAKLKISSIAPKVSGSVKLTLKDFKGNVKWSSKYEFNTGKDGEAEIKLNFNKINFQPGVYILDTDYELADGFRCTDIQRFSFFRFAKSKFPLCSYAQRTPPWALFYEIMDRVEKAGYGTIVGRPTNLFETVSSYSDYLKEIKKRNFHLPPAIVMWGPTGIYKFPFYKNSIMGRMKDLGTDKLPITKSVLKEIEDVSEELARAFPENKKWYAFAEPDSDRFPFSFNAQTTMAKIDRAVYRGIKKASKDNKYYLSSCYNIFKGGGNAYTDRYLSSMGKNIIPYDGVDIHCYYTAGEDKSYDEDLTAFKAMLKKHGLDNLPIGSGEGGNTQPYNLPHWGISNGKQAGYFCGPPSYDIGFGEKLTAAFNFRHLLISLKHNLEEANLFDHIKNVFFDIELNSFLHLKGINTFCNLFSTAKFKKQIVPAPDVMCFVYEDGMKRPVAAVWMLSDSPWKMVDKEEGATMQINLSQAPEVYNIMEEKLELKPDSKGILNFEISYSPTILRGKPGTLRELCKAFSSANVFGLKTSMPL